MFSPTFILLILVAAVVWLILTYNRLIVLKNRCQEAWADIDVQLKRRHDLIPNLVETVKGYAGHERELFEKVTEARTRAIAAETVKDREGAENVLSTTLKTLFAVAENYPELKAATNFLELQREIRDTEDKIQAARRFYNTNVRDLNASLESFPVNMLAPMLSISKREFFGAEETDREPIKVQF